MQKEELQEMRTSYDLKTLELEDLHQEPLSQLRSWFKEAVDRNIKDANAMTLATVSEGGQPSVRIVLLKEIDEEGLVFYTNYRSRKGKEIEKNPKASMLFFWREMERQVRIEGKIVKTSEATSKEYFQSRPKGSQLGAWASPQSRVIVDRGELDDRLLELQSIYQNYDKLPKPAHWGGYRLVPHYYEFWQGRANRLHDRFEYKNEQDEWSINRLAP